MMNQDNPYAMNQTCKVCGEPAAGFHFGAFTCEGCKSFFGRSYNNLSSISDCKNNGECIINKKNRTACKACRLRKCLLVGMSKSGSRYGRRSNWFKIHCLLQEQQQQAAAAMAAHHNSQQQHHQQQQQHHHHMAAQHSAHALAGQKPPPTPGAVGVGVSPPAAAAAALGMLGHPGAYPGLYPPRTKEELMMLGLEEYIKHPAASPSVSSPDSHNSDSSVEVNVRGNTLLHLGGKHVTTESTTAAAAAATAAAPQLRKDLPPFLPLPFPGLASMPVMPPPAFLPPSHLLFPGYHPALYQHHQGLLKSSTEQQQAAAAAAAVQHLFNSTNATPSRFTPTMSIAPQHSPLSKLHDKDERSTQSPKSDALNNNHIPNGSKAAEELTKRFYLDAVLKSQRSSPPPAATKLPAYGKHDHSISALVTPNSESGREQVKSRQSNELEEEEDDDEAVATRSNGNDTDCGEDLVVSMTPPRSPVSNRLVEAANVAKPVSSTTTLLLQDNPIDLSMKTGSSVASSVSSKCSSGDSRSAQAVDSENEHETDIADKKSLPEDPEANEHIDVDDQEDDVHAAVVPANNVSTSNSRNNNNNNNNRDNSNSALPYDCSEENNGRQLEGVKRKLDALTKTEAEAVLEAETAGVKRSKRQTETVVTGLASVQRTTTPLDLTTKL